MEAKPTTILHSVWAVVYGYAIYYNVNYVSLPGHNVPPRNYAGRWKYLTFWNVVLQFVFYGVCILSAIFTNNRLKRFKDFFFATIVFPLALFVCLTFWGLYAVDRDLIYPPIMDEYFPRWLNHVLHTFIFPTTLFELYLQPHNYPLRGTGISYLMFFASIYIYWTLHIAYFAGIWVYPIFSVLNWMQRIVFFAIGLLLFVVFYIIGETLNYHLWVKVMANAEKKVKQKKTK